MKVRRALFSVSNREGLAQFAKELLDLGVEIFASSGTAVYLTQKGLAVHSVEDMIGRSDYVGGRVKTLHPSIHAAIMARRDVQSDLADLKELKTEPIDMVVCNLYPFAQKKSEGADEEKLCELIDIGGSSLLRAAAKNWPFVASVCEPDFYAPLVEELRDNDGKLTQDTLRELARRTFETTANYDRAISRYMAEQSAPEETEVLLPSRMVIDAIRTTQMKYGENPHQRAALYVCGVPSGIAGARRVKGETLSYNNLLDGSSAWRAVCAFSRPAAVVVKHMTPCGMAQGDSVDEALERALAGDPMSAYGSVIALNRDFSRECALKLKEAKIFTELIIAPNFADEALHVLKRKKKLRCLACEKDVAPPLEVRSISGGLLVQECDRYSLPDDYNTVGCVSLPVELRDTVGFAWQAVGAVKSNAVVIAREQELIGVGCGQTSRVDAVANAINKAKERTRGAVLASDAFLPFSDSIDLAAKAGIRAIIQPGGAKRDTEIIAACDEAGISMIFTRRRRFRH